MVTYEGNANIREGYYYKWYKLNTDTGECEVIEGEIEQSLAVYTDGAHQTYKVELVRTSDNAVIATSEHYQVPYYDQLQNGSFENPTVSGSAQLTNGLYEELVWLTTGFGSENTSKEADGQDIEIVNAAAAGSSYGETSAANGDQYAELNCETAGTLYQDVLTIPEVPLYWQLSHEGREGDDTMCVIIVDAGFSDSYITTQDDVDAVIAAARAVGLTDPSTNGSTEITFTYTDTASGESVSITVWLITSDSDEWHEYSGTYTVPEDQYLTRFLFGAVSTSNNNLTTGNLLDNVSFSQTAPTSTKSGNITITKTVDGLDDSTVIPAGTYTFTVYDSSNNAIGTASLPTANAAASQTLYWTYTLTGITAGSYYVVESDVTYISEGYTYTGTVSIINSGSSSGNTQSSNFIVSNSSTTMVDYTNMYSGSAEMPEMGGWGTQMYTIVGLLLTGGAVLMMYSRRQRTQS
ncbi:MAG: hypothetical protein LUI01_04900 [Firmicutes bacterium]|nr:hypothetical protein [Bacillota bacterium]